jgi:diguanylate cyclase (GGDEF)-like protein
MGYKNMSVIRTMTRGPGQKLMEHCRILLVEDQPSVAQVIATTLHQRLGCKVLIAINLAQVREILASNETEFFAVVTDLNLPDAANGEVVDVLLPAKLPVIAVSGSFDERVHESLTNKGVVDYVLKGSINAYEYIAGLLERLYRNRSIRVLVVDDSESFRELMRHMLTRQLLQVGVAKDAKEGLKALERHPEIALVLVDQHMPGVDGFSFVAKVREKWSKDRLAIIGISGIENKLISSQFIRYGANDFIAKPFSYEELVCRVSQNLNMLESFAAIRHAAYHDYLTGVFNRRYFFEAGGAAFDLAAKQGRPMAVVILDVDFFKNINDIYGHDVGDQVLVGLSNMLREHFPKEFVARLGGEEFGLLMHGGVDDVLPRLEAFRQVVSESSVGEAVTVRFSVSGGVEAGLQANLDAALKVADDRLYQAKESGRNQIVTG